MINKNPKRAILLRHGGGRLGNQLWLMASIYAFCLEKNYIFLNYSFYDYIKYYDISTPHLITTIFEKISTFRIGDAHFYTYPIYVLYKWCTHLFRLKPKQILRHYSDDLFLLPPTPNNNNNQRRLLERLFISDEDIYFDGHNFSNPLGIKKYHKQITKLLKPKSWIIKNVEKFIKPYAKYYKVGVHIRQGDYKRFRNGDYYFDQHDVVIRLKYFLDHIYKGNKKVIFFLFSDGEIENSLYKNLNFLVSRKSNVEDLYTLAKCDLIIASKSSFSSFAAYYGGIKLYLFDRKTLLKPHNYYLWQL